MLNYHYNFFFWKKMIKNYLFKYFQLQIFHPTRWMLLIVISKKIVIVLSLQIFLFLFVFFINAFALPSQSLKTKVALVVQNRWCQDKNLFVLDIYIYMYHVQDMFLLSMYRLLLVYVLISLINMNSETPIVILSYFSFEKAKTK